MLYYVLLCYIVIYYFIIDYIRLYYIRLFYYITLDWNISYYTILYDIILYCIIWFYVIFYCITLHYITLYFTINTYLFIYLENYIDWEIHGNPPFKGNRVRSFPNLLGPRQVDEHCLGRRAGCVGWLGQLGVMSSPSSAMLRVFWYPLVNSHSYGNHQF